MSIFKKSLLCLSLLTASIGIGAGVYALDISPNSNTHSNIKITNNNNSRVFIQSDSKPTSFNDSQNITQTLSASDDDIHLFTPFAYKNREQHQTVVAHALGEGEYRVYVFLPESPRPTRSLPTVFLHHGWLGISPLNFGALIDHLTRTGHAVIYPVYQTSDATNPQSITNNAVHANKNAISFIQSQGHQIDEDRVLYVGFSMGANITANIAAHPTHHSLPAPKGIVLLATGDAHHVKHGTQGKSTLPHLKDLPKNLPTIIMTGEADTQIGVPTSHKIAKQICHIPSNKRVFLTLPSDTRGDKTVKSGHGSVGAPDSRYDFSLKDTNFPRNIPRLPEFEPSVSLNNLDFYGYWRAITLLDDSLSKSNPVVLGAGKTGQLSLGSWSDGTPFAKMNIINHCHS